ncbi:MAG: hypothetical protein DRP08_05835, partial [Candidatus Aenigmatarchaeota archaeon]
SIYRYINIKLAQLFQRETFTYLKDFYPKYSSFVVDIRLKLNMKSICIFIIRIREPTPPLEKGEGVKIDKALVDEIVSLIKGISSSTLKHDRHIHLEGAISTQGIREIVRKIIPLMSDEERERFWNLTAYHPERIVDDRGKIRTVKFQRFKDMDPAQMERLILDPYNEDPYCQRLSLYTEYNPDVVSPSILLLDSISPTSVKFSLRSYLHTFYAMGAILFDIENEDVIKVVSKMGLEDVAKNALKDGVNILDLRIKLDKPKSMFNIELMKALSESARGIMKEYKEKGIPVQINFVIPFDRNILARLLKKESPREMGRFPLDEYEQEKLFNYIQKNFILPLRELKPYQLAMFRGIDITGNRKPFLLELESPAYLSIYILWVRKNLIAINYFIEELEKLRKEKGIAEPLTVYAHLGEYFDDPIVELSTIKIYLQDLIRLNFIIHGAVFRYLALEPSIISSTPEEFFELMREKGIKVICSLSSNLHTHCIEKIEDYPVKFLLRNGIEVLPSTDNPRVDKTTLSKEKELLNRIVSSPVFNKIDMAMNYFILAKKVSSSLRKIVNSLEKYLEKLNNVLRCINIQTFQEIIRLSKMLEKAGVDPNAITFNLKQILYQNNNPAQLTQVRINLEKKLSRGKKLEIQAKKEKQNGRFLRSILRIKKRGSTFVAGKVKDWHILLTCTHVVYGIENVLLQTNTHLSKEIGIAKVLLHHLPSSDRGDLAILVLRKEKVQDRKLLPIKIKLKFSEGELAVLVSGCNEIVSSGFLLPLKEGNVILVEARSIPGDLGSPYLIWDGKEFKAVAVTAQNGPVGMDFATNIKDMLRGLE